MTTDAVLTVSGSSGFYDLNIDGSGDIESDDFFDTSILYSIFGEKRASGNEMVEPQQRRGWIGNGTFENGSKLWLLSQARMTRDTLNKLEDEAEKALQWLVDDGLAVSIDDVTASVTGQLSVTISRSRDKVDRKFFTLWENTGRAT